MNYLIEIELGNTDLIEVTPEIMQEREIAIFDSVSYTHLTLPTKRIV